MRFIITLITSLILLLPASGQGEWKRVNVGIDSVPLPTDPNKWVRVDGFLDVHFIDRDKGYFVGGGYYWHHNLHGILYKTEDGGKTWNLIYQDNRHFFSSIHFVNESKGFLSLGEAFEDSDGGLFGSSDGGHNWTKDTIIGGAVEFFFLNDSTGWACDDRYKIFKTINGGDDWNESYRHGLGGGINSLFFIDDSTGWAVGDRMIMKCDLNEGCERVIVPDLPMNEVFFVDRDKGWISGGYSNHDGFGAIFTRTVDGGETWTKTEGLNYLINDFYFENSNHGWAVGEYGGAYDEAKGVILETYNSGVDWDVVKDSLPARLNALHFTDGIGWAVGDDGLVLKYTPTATRIKEDKNITSDNEPLFQNYPNPFQSTTIITYQLPAISNVELSVYDISGRKVATVVNVRQQTDKYEVEWNAEGINSGIYFCELKTGQGRQVMKMTIVR